VVFPDALHKFYLDASPAERARRRHAELQGLPSGSAARPDDIESSLRRRDGIDRSRSTAPLRTAEDAVIIDSTSMPIEQVVEFVLRRATGTGGTPRP